MILYILSQVAPKYLYNVTLNISEPGALRDT